MDREKSDFGALKTSTKTEPAYEPEHDFQIFVISRKNLILSLLWILILEPLGILFVQNKASKRKKNNKSISNIALGISAADVFNIDPSVMWRSCKSNTGLYFLVVQLCMVLPTAGEESNLSQGSSIG